MPIYEYKCNRCGNIQENYFPISSDFSRVVYCNTCQSLTERIFSVPTVIVPNIEIKKIEQKAITDGYIIHEPGLDKDAKRNKKYMEEDIRKNIRKSIESTLRDFGI